MEIKIHPTRGYSSINYSLLKEDNSIIHRRTMSACFGGIGNFFERFEEGRYLLLTENKENSPYDEDAVKWWVEFITDCGFKCTFEEDSIEFKIRVDFNDYKNNLHFFTALTAIRPVFYRRDYIANIPQACNKIKNLFPEWDSLQVLYLAHYAVKREYIDNSHTMVYEKCFKLLSKPEFEKRVEKYKDTFSINNLCTQQIDTSKTHAGIHDIIKTNKKENYQKAYDLLTK